MNDRVSGMTDERVAVWPWRNEWAIVGIVSREPVVPSSIGRATAYASHFLFPGHEAGLVVDPPINNVNRQGAITKVELTQMRRTA
jgi:hypothetical protein